MGVRMVFGRYAVSMFFLHKSVGCVHLSFVSMFFLHKSVGCVHLSFTA